MSSQTPESPHPAPGVRLPGSGHESPLAGARAGLPLASLALALMIISPALAQGPPNRPDLIADPNILAESWNVGFRFFPPGDCAINEGCILAPGIRRVLTFSTLTANISQNSFDLGDPNRDPGFHFDECHQHFHFEEWADYQLLDDMGQVAAPGHKQSFCVIETDQYIFEPWVGPGSHGCDFQGLDGGWADIYLTGLDCQWVDVTGVPGGTYELANTVNPTGAVRESDTSNNTGSTSVILPGPEQLPDLVPDEGRIQSTLSIQESFFASGSLPDLDGCIGGTGLRTLLTFDFRAWNLSQGDFFLGSVDSSAFYTFDPVHGHHHVQDLLAYELVDPNTGVVAASGFEQTWIPEDKAPVVQASWVRPHPFYEVTRNLGGFITDSNTGIQRGWRANGRADGHCRWIDVTDVPNGNYILNVTVNPAGVHAEADLSNNSTAIPVVLDHQGAPVAHRPDGNSVAGEPLAIRQVLDLLQDPPKIVSEITFDVSTCSSPGYNLFYSLLTPGDYTYSGSFCGLNSVTGLDRIDLPTPPTGSMLWFVVAGSDGNTDGGHGFDSALVPRPLTGIGSCGIQRSEPDLQCP